MGTATQGLLRRALSGEARAVRSLHEALGPAIHGGVATALYRYRAAIAASDVRQLVADLVQDVWEQLYRHDARHLRSWDPARGASLETWVRRFAFCRTLDTLRTRKSNPATEQATEADELGRSQGGSAHPERQLGDRQLFQRLDAAMRTRLDGVGIACYEELLIRGRPVKEVAAELGLAVDATFKRQQRLRKLARDIRDELLAPGSDGGRDG